MNYVALVTSLLADSDFVASPATMANYYAYRIVSFIFILLMFLAAIAAIVLILLQPGNSQGIDALGGSSETFFGKNKGKSTEAKLKKWTVICLVVLTVLAIIFFILQIPEIWGLIS